MKCSTEIKNFYFFISFQCWDFIDIVTYIDVQKLKKKLNQQVIGPTHCGLVTPYGNTGVGQTWFR